MAFVGSAHGPGPLPVRRRLSRVHRPRRTGTAGTGRQGRSAGSGAARSRRRGHGPARLDGQAPRATVAGESDERRERRSAAQGPGMRRDQRRAASAPACRRYASLEGSKARSAPLARCTGRAGAACSAGFRGAKCNAAGRAAGRPLESRHARSAHDEEKQKEGRSPRCLHQSLLRHRQDRVARHDQVI